MGGGLINRKNKNKIKHGLKRKPDVNCNWGKNILGRLMPIPLPLKIFGGLIHFLIDLNLFWGNFGGKKNK